MTEAEAVDPSEWVDRYGDYLFRYAMLRLGDRERAEDLVQETFLAALKGRSSFAGRSSEGTWLVGILKHKIIDHFRRQSLEGAVPRADVTDTPGEDPFNADGHWASGPTDWGGNPAHLFRQKEFVEQLSKCLSGLPPTHAAVFTLREIEGAGTEEICKELKVSSTNLWVMLHRARMQLRKCLEISWFHGSAEGGS